MTDLKGPKALLWEAWAKYKERPKLFLAMAAVPAIFTFLATLQSPQKESIREISPENVIIGIILWLVQVWAMLALLRSMSEKENRGMAAYFKDVLPRLWPAIMTSIIAGLMVLGGFILLIIPGVILALSFSFYSQVVLFEELQNWPALARSKEYAKDIKLALLWRYIVVGVVWIAAAAVVQIIAQILFSAASKPLIAAIVSGTLAFFLQPLFSAYTYLLYENVKAVKGHAPAV